MAGIILLPELHSELLSRLARPLNCSICMAIAERCTVEVLRVVGVTTSKPYSNQQHQHHQQKPGWCSILLRAGLAYKKRLGLHIKPEMVVSLTYCDGL